MRREKLGASRRDINDDRQDEMREDCQRGGVSRQEQVVKERGIEDAEEWRSVVHLLSFLLSLVMYSRIATMRDRVRSLLSYRRQPAT